MKALGWIVLFASGMTVLGAEPDFLPHLGVSDDSDLAPPVAQVKKDISRKIEADRVLKKLTSQGLAEIVLTRIKDGKKIPISGLEFKFGKTVVGSTDENGRLVLSVPQSQTLRAELKTGYFRIYGEEGNYFFDAQVEPGVVHEIEFDEVTDGGQAMGIWQVAYRAYRKLEKTAGLSFWKRVISIRWPSDGDYYSFNEVHLTRGHFWDVVGHELGHAIYHQAAIGQMQGGRHLIDQCYTRTLALSEGWASFFSGWVSLDLTDSDAKFQYMVPRLAPLPLEALPAHPCVGPDNEWRVAAFLWDLIDLHPDTENADAAFAWLWKQTAGKNVRSIDELTQNLQTSGLRPETIQAVWELNFRAPR